MALKTVADLLGVWLQTESDCNPSTRQNHGIAASQPANDPLVHRARSR